MSRALLAAVVILVALAAAQPDPPSANRDVKRALETARRLAAAGNVIAQFSVGSMLYYGGTDTAQAIRWIRKAAAQQYPPAEFQMGQLYDFGFGVGQNDQEALRWYRRAAIHGHAAAQRAVGEFYHKGRSVAANPAEAARWFQRAADGDDLRAQYHLGQMYFDGVGVPQDYASAYVWFSLAASQTPLEDNRKGLVELRDIAAGRMPPAALRQAARRVAAWKPALPR